MKMLFDFFPIIIFFASYHLFGKDMVIATEAGIAATVLQVALFWLRHRRFEKMHLITLALISVFGSITIMLGDSIYIKLKTTVLEWVFALTFLGSQFFGKKNLVERMMGVAVKAPEHIWRKLNYAWVVYFTCMGFLNLYIVYNFSDDIWLNFKTFGMLGMTILFVILQSVYVARHGDAEFIEQKAEAGANKVKSDAELAEQQGKK